MRAVSRHWQVLLTWLLRPIYWALFIAGLACFGIAWKIDHVGWIDAGSLGRRLSRVLPFRADHWWGPSVTLVYLMDVLAHLAVLVMLLAIAGLFLTQMREQLTNWRSRLVPGYLGPHRTVSLCLFGLIVAGITYINLGERRSTFGVFVLILTAATAILCLSLLTHPPTVLAILGGLFLVTGLGSGLEPIVREMILDTSLFRRHAPPGLLPEIWCIRFVLLAIDLAALVLTLRRPWRMDAIRSSLTRMPFRPAQPVLSGPSAPRPPHRRLDSVLARGRHRRTGVHGPATSIIIAISVALLLVLMRRLTAGDDGTLFPTMGLMLLNTLPVAIAAFGWRERQRTLGYEMLFPVERDQFAIETLAALAVDLLEFWIAALIATLIVFALLERGLLRSRMFEVCLCASALMQIFLLGGMVMLLRVRQPAWSAAMIALLLLCMLIPLLEVWHPKPAISLPLLMRIAVAEMIAGAAMIAFGWSLWRRAEPI